MNTKSILLVDDEKIIPDSIAWVLEKNNFSVTQATSGQEAINLLRLGPYDLIITGLEMAGVDGISLLKQAKILYPDIGVIILTGHPDVSTAVEAFKYGSNDYLEKTCNHNDLIYAVNRSFEKQDRLVKLREQNEQLKDEIAAQKIREDQLQVTQTHLEQLVQEKTKELRHTVEELNIVLDTLLVKEKELEFQNQELNNASTALTVLLKRRDQENAKIRKELADNIEEKVLPLLKKANSKVADQVKGFLNTAQANLMDIFTSHSHANPLMYANLTPRELQIVYYIRKNKTSKEIAPLLDIKVSTVEFYRENIRKKLRIKNKKISLKKFITTLR